MHHDPDPLNGIAEKMFKLGHGSHFYEPMATAQLLAKELLTESDLTELRIAGKVLTHVEFPKGIGKKIRFHFESGGFSVFTFQFGRLDYNCDLGSAPIVLPDLLRTVISEPKWQFSLETEGGVIILANAARLIITLEESAPDDLVTLLHLFLEQSGFSEIHEGFSRSSRRRVEAGHHRDIVSLGILAVRVLAECFKMSSSTKVFGRFGPRP